jgi:hypothetical protein
MTPKKRRPQKPASTRNVDPLDRLRRAQDELRRAQSIYDKALKKRSEAVRDAAEGHPVAEVAAALEISQSKVYEILGRFRAPRRTNAPEEPMLPF